MKGNKDIDDHFLKEMKNRTVGPNIQLQNPKPHPFGLNAAKIKMKENNSNLSDLWRSQ
jgi:hypothetical protein